MHHVLSGHEHFLFFPLFAPLGEDAFESFFGLLFLVAQCGGFLEILSLDRGFLIDSDLFELFFDFFDVRRTGHGIY